MITMDSTEICKPSRGPIIKYPLFIYKTVARIVAGVINKEGTLRSLVYAYTQRLIKTHLRLAIEVTRHRNLLERLIAKTDLAKQEDLSLELTQVLVYELLLSPQKELPKGIDIFDKVSSYSKELNAALEEIQNSGDFKNLVVERPEATLPRYVRVNTLLTTLDVVLQKLQRLGFQLINTEGKSYNEFLDSVRRLQDKQFVKDYHFPDDLLVFNPREFISKLSLYNAGHIAMHDKTSYFPVTCLAAPPGSQVLDACAAPGMKTAHIAARLQNNGIIYAFDPHERRYNLMLENLSHSGVTCCESKCKDFTSINPYNEQITNVEYLLLDLPCTGSGMVNRLDHLTDDLDSKSSQRIWKLSALQFKFLCHAFKFPNVRRIVYSTCSVEVQENERVIQDVLDKNPGIFKVVEAFPEWQTRGDQEFEFGHLCVRAEPLKDLTNGFFVAVLEKIHSDSDSGNITPVSHSEKFGTSSEKPMKEEKLENSGFKHTKGLEVKLKKKHLKDQTRRRTKRNKRGKREREMERTGNTENNMSTFPKNNNSVFRSKIDKKLEESKDETKKTKSQYNFEVSFIETDKDALHGVTDFTKAKNESPVCGMKNPKKKRETTDGDKHTVDDDTTISKQKKKRKSQKIETEIPSVLQIDTDDQPCEIANNIKPSKKQKLNLKKKNRRLMKSLLQRKRKSIMFKKMEIKH